MFERRLFERPDSPQFDIMNDPTRPTAANEVERVPGGDTGCIVIAFENDRHTYIFSVVKISLKVAKWAFSTR